MLATLEPETKKSTHRVEVVPVVLEKHPNADSLSVVNVFGGYTCCVKTADWHGITKAAYIPPDSVVDVRRPEFAFLADQAKGDGTARIKAKKLRGVVSFGLLVPLPAIANVGDDLADALGVTHYEPPTEQERAGRNNFVTGGEAAEQPKLFTVKYDLDAFRRYHRLFTPGEPVFVTEKIDGANARYVYQDGQMHCGSRTEWKKEYPSYDHLTVESLTAQGMDANKASEVIERLQSKPKTINLWWAALHATPGLEKFCRDNPGVIVYGEVFGYVQKLRYGHKPGTVSFAAFDLMRDGHWLNPHEARELGKSLPWVPLLAGGMPFDFDAITALAEGPSQWPGADHIREGCVVKPLVERRDPHIGRVCFKCVGGAYLEKYR